MGSIRGSSTGNTNNFKVTSAFEIVFLAFGYVFLAEMKFQESETRSEFLSRNFFPNLGTLGCCKSWIYDRWWQHFSYMYEDRWVFKLKMKADFSHQKWFIESTWKNVRGSKEREKYFYRSYISQCKFHESRLTSLSLTSGPE